MEWTKYTTKEALKDNDELMILDKDANANKRTLMDKIWDYVVDKMTTAVIAKLGTTNKTLIGAVNELNSKSFKYLGRRNDYDVESLLQENLGKIIYFIVANASATPLNYAFVKTVVWDSRSECMQIAYSFVTGRNIICIRQYQDNTWSSWRTL